MIPPELVLVVKLTAIIVATIVGLLVAESVATLLAVVFVEFFFDLRASGDDTDLDATEDAETTHSDEGEWEFDVGDTIKYQPTGREKVVTGRVYDVDDEEYRYVYSSDDCEYWIQARGWAEYDHELKDGEE